MDSGGRHLPARAQPALRLSAPSFELLAGSAWLALAAAAWLIGRGWLSLSTLESLPLCAFRFWTGWRCPGCGMAHALLYAFQGSWSQSIAHHALGLPVLAVWTGWMLWRAGLRLSR
ncbi:MAG: DUF2752 domain-containing protein [Elusimicrobia bacterium]|nr:DUF2752 domain-containing protein [Elusimicrobiota bacterium]